MPESCRGEKCDAFDLAVEKDIWFARGMNTFQPIRRLRDDEERERRLIDLFIQWPAE